MFKVTGGGSSYADLTAEKAASKARAMRREGHNDVEIFRPDGSRISLYSLEQMLKATREAPRQ